MTHLTKRLYFTTTTVVDWIDIFSRPRYRYVIIESLDYCRQHKGLHIYAWVLMTNHLHIVAGTEEGQSISDILRDFKKFTNKKIIEILFHLLRQQPLFATKARQPDTLCRISL